MDELKEAVLANIRDRRNRKEGKMTLSRLKELAEGGTRRTVVAIVADFGLNLKTIAEHAKGMSVSLKRIADAQDRIADEMARSRVIVERTEGIHTLIQNDRVLTFPGQYDGPARQSDWKSDITSRDRRRR